MQDKACHIHVVYAGSTGVASTSYDTASEPAQPRSGMHDRAFGTAGWGSPAQPSSRKPHKKGSANVAESALVHIGPLTASDRKAHQEQSAAPKFIKAKSFGGAKAAYAFKTGPKGLGYYLEAGASGLAAKQRQIDREEVGLQAASVALQDTEQPLRQSRDGADSDGDMQPVKGGCILP